MRGRERFAGVRARVASWVAVVASFASGCTTATARFPPSDVETAVVRSDMRRLETEKLVVYYPEGSRPEALRIAARLEYCRRELERLTRIHGAVAAEKSIFVLPEVPFNNGYVQPPSGSEQIAVVPQYNTATDAFVLLDIPPDPSAVGCHEMVHDVHARQVSGGAAILRTLFGHAYTPQSGLDPWFWEGLAVYYETKLQGFGRLASPYFDGVFAAAMAGRSIDGGDLHAYNRELKFGAPYLVGSHFIDFLVRRHGEQRLWRLIAAQSNEIFYPFGINALFRSAYGESLSALIDAFDADVKARYPRRERRLEQRRVLELTQHASLAVARSGHSALLTQGLDELPRLTVRDCHGTEVVSRRLKDLGVGRRLVEPTVGGTSGLSMTPDGRHAYFVVADVGPVFGESRLLHLDVEDDRLEVVEDHLFGSGGSISPDGTRYYFSRPKGDSMALAYYDVTTHRGQRLTAFEPRRYLTNPVVSPDGLRLLVTEVSDSGVGLAVYGANDGRRERIVPAPRGMAFQGSWVDDQRVVFSGSDGPRLQVFEADLRSGTYRKLTDAPYVAAQPFVAAGKVRFLNREAEAWTLDEVPHPALPAEPPQRTVAAARGPFLSEADARHRKPDDVDPRVLSDEEYSAFERLFVPQLWGPHFSFRREGQVAFGAFVSGGDRLGLQRWAVAGAWDRKAQLPSGSLSYLNTMAAPWRVRLELGHIGRREEETQDLVPNPGPLRIRETLASLMISRGFYHGTFVSAGGRYLDADYELEAIDTSVEQYRFAGPMLELDHSAFDRTSYGGARLGFGAAIAGTYFPAELGEPADFDVVDGLATLRVVLPLPLSARHKLTLNGAGRGLFGVPPDVGLLQVGGGGGDYVGARLLPPGLRFFQPVRGFEDLALFGRRVVAGEATYTYPFVIDEGTATSLLVLPAFFLRQVDLDVFLSAASLVDAGREEALAVGAALDVRVVFWLLPLTLRFQEARRLSHDEELAFYFSVLPD